MDIQLNKRGRVEMTRLLILGGNALEKKVEAGLWGCR